MQFLIKIVITSLIIVGVSEIAKKVSWMAAILASLPIVSIFAMIWLYLDTKDVQKVITLSNGIFWAVLPSLLFFVVLSALLKLEVNFTVSMCISMGIMAVGYVVYVVLLSRFGIKI